MIDSLTLENWKTHKHSTFHFRKGTNVLVGVIDSGKSSVLDGICYGLFGTFPALKSSRVKTEDLLTRKPSSADLARVEVCFSHSGKKYRVERLLKRSGINEGRLYAEEKLIAGPKPTQTTERVEQELGVSYELFVRGVYSEQNQVDYFLKLNPGERKKKFDELLDLQKYEVVRMNANQVALQFKRKVETDKSQLAQFESMLQSQDLNELRLRVAQLHQQIAQTQEKKTQLQDELASLAKKKAKMEEDWKTLKLLKEKQQQLLSKKTLLREQVQQFDSANPHFAGKMAFELEQQKNQLLAEYKRNVDVQKEQQSAELRMQKALQKMDLAQKNKERIQKELQNKSLEEIQFINEQILGQLSALEKELLEKERVWQECKSQLFSLKEKLQQLHAEEKDLSALHASCPTCKQGISSEHKQSLSQQIASRRASMQQDQLQLQKSQDVCGEEVQRLKNDLKEWQSKQQSAAVLQSKVKDLERMESELSACRSECDAAKQHQLQLGESIVEKQLSAISQQVYQADLALQNALKVQELGKMSVDLDSIEKQMHWFSISEEAVLEVNQLHAQMFAQANGLESEWKMLQQSLKDVQGRVDGLDLMQKELQRLSLRVERGKEVEEAMGVWGSALIHTQQQLRAWVLEAVNLALQELWPQVYPYRDYTMAQLVADDNDYVLRVQERLGNWVDVESALSGGERSAAALTLRMAIAFVLTRQLSWMILDEPTHNLDERSVRTLSSMLREKLPTFLDQIFVITHNPEIEKSATGSLYLLQREKNEDGATIPIVQTIDHGTKVE